MQNISGFGLLATLIASKTYPIALPLTQFADDSDPVDFPAIEIADTAMGLNGDLLAWSKAVTIKVTLNIIPSSIDDVALGILLEANRVGKGKQSAGDIITLSIINPQSLSVIQLTNGVITSGMPGNSVASAGRLKTKPYIFAFENKTGT